MKHGCVNLDWLEVFCIEDPNFPLDPLNVAKLGFEVRKREYGTPQYQEMYTCYRSDIPILEVRRLPYSLRHEGGIFEKGSCHIRYNNRTCYNVNPVQEMTNFIRRARLQYKSISRCDICLDFVEFDNGQTPVDFIKAYMSDRILKMHQSKLRGVSRNIPNDDTFSFGGRDCCGSKHINSLKWGGKGCPVSTKLYNKCQEMRDTKYKSYIVDAWEQAKLVTRQRETTKDGKQRSILVRDGVQTDVWRLEFSVKLQGAKFVETDRGGIIDFNLDMLSSRDKLLALFHALSLQYWDFRKPAFTESGKQKASNRLQRIAYIKAKLLAHAYVPKHLSTAKDLSRFERSVVNKLNQWATSIYASAEDAMHLRKVIAFVSTLFRAEIVGFDVDRMYNDIGLHQIMDYKSALQKLKNEVTTFTTPILDNILKFYEDAAILIYKEMTARENDSKLAYQIANCPF